MTTYHAVVWMDQKEAHVLQFDAESMKAERVKSRTHHQRHGGMDAKEEAAYFQQIAHALQGIKEVLLVGPGSIHEEFKAWAGKASPAVSQSVVGSEKADHPTDGQVVAMARRYFHKYDTMSGAQGA